MTTTSIGPSLERLQGLFLSSYNQQPLRELLLFKMSHTLAHEVSEGDNFHTIVFNLLVKALMERWSRLSSRGGQEAISQAAERLPLIDLDPVVKAASAAARWVVSTISPTDQCCRLKDSLALAMQTLGCLAGAIDRANRRTAGRP